MANCMRLSAWLSLALCATLAGCASTPSFQAPTEGATIATGPATPDSHITLQADIPFSEISAAIAAHLPPQSPLSGNGNLTCARIPSLIPFDLKGKETCAAYSWTATLTPEGPASITRQDDALRLEQPVRIDGRGGLSGDLAKLLALNSKPFSAHIAPGALARLSLDQNWCPQLSVTPTERWVTSASVEVIGKTCVDLNLGPFGKKPICVGPANLDLTGPANLALKSTQANLIKTLQAQTSCEKVRAPLQSVWKTAAIPLGQAMGQTAFLNITPVSAQVSQLLNEEDRVRVIANVTAKITVEPSPIPVQSLPLPALGRAVDQPGGVELNVQLLAPYAPMRAALKAALVGQSFQNLAASAKVRDATLYASGDALVIGLQLDLKTPGKVLNDTGWIYLIGRPSVGPDGRSLSVLELKDAAVLNNKALKAALILLNGPILAEVRKQSQFDLSASLDKASDGVAQALASAHPPGLNVKAGRAQITLQSLSLSQAGVAAVAHVSMPLSVTVTRSVLPPGR